MHNPYQLGEPRDIIRQLRDKRGFASDRALAIAAGIPQPTLARYLNGTTESMDVANFMALAEVLEVTLSELLGEVPISSGGRLRELIKVMEQLPEPQRDALVAAAQAMVNANKKAPS